MRLINLSGYLLGSLHGCCTKPMPSGSYLSGRYELILRVHCRAGVNATEVLGGIRTFGRFTLSSPPLLSERVRQPIYREERANDRTEDLTRCCFR